jgi:hypothetical protein
VSCCSFFKRHNPDTIQCLEAIDLTQEFRIPALPGILPTSLSTIAIGSATGTSITVELERKFWGASLRPVFFGRERVADLVVLLSRQDERQRCHH